MKMITLALIIWVMTGFQVTPSEMMAHIKNPDQLKPICPMAIMEQLEDYDHEKY